jgi:hypothetical protein
MASLPIKVNNRVLHIQKAVVAPAFVSKTILVEDNWDFVDLWLRKQSGQRKAEFFWKQARSFYDAAKLLPKTSSPLPSYYCALNAAKALLISKKVQLTNLRHGLTGTSTGAKTNLTNEQVTVCANGIFPELCRYLGESVNGEKYDLKAILYNLPFLHRAYCTTFKTAEELFIPISEPIFVRKEKAKDAWFCCEIRDRKYTHAKVFQRLAGFERDTGRIGDQDISDKFVVRLKKRFSWQRGGTRAANLTALTKYHRRVRNHTSYILGLTRLWYLKRNYNNPDIINRTSLTLMFMALHRLSELARYSPDVLDRHFNGRHNWLLSQFITRSLDQFVDEISAEITGYDFMTPGYTSR